MTDSLFPTMSVSVGEEAQVGYAIWCKPYKHEKYELVKHGLIVPNTEAENTWQWQARKSYDQIALLYDIYYCRAINIDWDWPEFKHTQMMAVTASMLMAIPLRRGIGGYVIPSTKWSDKFSYDELYQLVKKRTGKKVRDDFELRAIALGLHSYGQLKERRRK